jgi:DNA-directed RNA polymerase I subunit RPA2
MIADPEDTRLLLPKPLRVGDGDGKGQTHGHLPVLLDGRVVGCVAVGRAEALVAELRALKVAELARRVSEGRRDSAIPEAACAAAAAAAGRSGLGRGVPVDLECALVMPLSASGGGPFPGLYLAGGAARLVRPVLNLASGGAPEWVGPLEQMFLAVGCQDAEPLAATHREISPMNILSVVASLTPFSDMNQSPRNMYQCQMGKQTMGTPCHNWTNRRDNKMYRIQHTQAPIVQNRAQAQYRIDDHSNGCNAIVAVLSYTGYDMEDAMIIGKGSYDRGFGHASVYKTKTVDLCERTSVAKEAFGLEAAAGRSQSSAEGGAGGPAAKPAPGAQQGAEKVDADGLPKVGARLVKGDAMYCTVDKTTGKPHWGVYKDNEPCVVEDVQLLNASGGSELTKISIKLRYNRNPVVGDKFSSRHGQKGVLSFLYPQQDMPFTESGMSPDIIINPHAFPSRMTIGMLVESMAGKAGALHGHYQDSTPFRFDEKNRAVDYFGEQLRAAGYNYYGSEPMYSGVTGEEMQADIFIGCVYYQRLRHMVSDKSQVRSTGPMNSLTMQPVKGRKRGGGIRFGEMERDSLIAHGTSFLLQDRLCNSSDRHDAWVCADCGSMLGFEYRRRGGAAIPGQRLMKESAEGALQCRLCRSRRIEQTAMPYVVRYLANELAAMNIRMGVELS